MSIKILDYFALFWMGPAETGSLASATRRLEEHMYTTVQLCPKLIFMAPKMFSLVQDSTFYYMCPGSITFSHGITDKQKLRYVLLLHSRSRCSNFTHMTTCTVSDDVYSLSQTPEVRVLKSSSLCKPVHWIHSTCFHFWVQLWPELRNYIYKGWWR